MVFAGTLGLNRSFAAEQDQGSFEGLMMAVPELSVIYLAKMITNLLMMFGLAILVIPIYSLLYNQSLFDLRFFGILMLGAWGYSAAGTHLEYDGANAHARFAFTCAIVPVIAASEYGCSKIR